MLNAHKYRALVTKAIVREQTRIRVQRHRAEKGVNRKRAEFRAIKEGS